MGVKYTAFDSELDIAQLGIIDKLWIYPRSSVQSCVSNFFYRFPAVACSEYVGQQ